MTAIDPAPAALPAGLRRPVALVVVVATALFALLVVRFAGTAGPGRLDEHVDRLLDPLGAAHAGVFWHVREMGAPVTVVVLALGLAATCLLARHRRLAVLALVGPGLTGLLTTALKPAVGRTIGDSYAFPSGHTGGATAVALVAALLVIALARPNRGVALGLLAAAALLAGGAVAVAMVATDAHYPTDTVGGLCVAVSVVLGCVLLLDRLPGPLGRRRQPAP